MRFSEAANLRIAGIDSYTDTTIQKAIKASAAASKIHKNVTPHTLRLSYATGLLEAGVDLLTISRLLGHATFATKMVYLHCRGEHLYNIPNPMDWLPVRQLPTYQPPTKHRITDNGSTS